MKNIVVSAVVVVAAVVYISIGILSTTWTGKGKVGLYEDLTEQKIKKKDSKLVS